MARRARNHEGWFKALEAAARRDGNNAAVSCLMDAEGNANDTPNCNHWEIAYDSIAHTAIFNESSAVRGWFEVRGYEW